MAYNLQSLITILQQILHPEQTHWSFDHNKPQLESLLEKTESLMQILEKSSPTKVASLDSQIRETAYKAEDIIESQMVHQMLSNPESESLTFPTPDLQQVTQELDSAAVFAAEKTMASSDLTQQIESMKLEVEEKSASSSRSKSDLGVEDLSARVPFFSVFDLQFLKPRQVILEKSSHTKVASLESQIRDAVFEAEDIIESQMVHQMLSNPDSESLAFSTPDLQQVTRELDSAAVFMGEKTMASRDLQQLESTKLVESEEKSASSQRYKSDYLVGVDADLLELKDRLTNMERKVEIVPIVGMGGIEGATRGVRKLRPQSGYRILEAKKSDFCNTNGFSNTRESLLDQAKPVRCCSFVACNMLLNIS
ncbi:hypothetical protein AAHA92_31705 [Salvia divinorum]|uniref:Uncharacterized protein n=1 Tax=Salvia divinorum TaxID=28513 RepID=A0ABD1FLF6_SALDI